VDSPGLHGQRGALLASTQLWRRIRCRSGCAARATVRAPAGVLSVRLSSPDRHPKTSGFDVAEGRI
jgi:hypothetical protein